MTGDSSYKRDVTNTETPMTPSTAPVLTGEYTCPIDGQVFPSYANWTRNDKVHAAEIFAARRSVISVEDRTVPTTGRDSVDPKGYGTGSGGSSVPEGATEKQVAFLNRLLAERPAYRDVENLFPENVARLTKRQASKKIDEIVKTDPENRPNVTVGDPGQAAPVRPNKYAGSCSICGGQVDAGSGTILKVADRWTVRHIGTCPAGPETAVQPVSQPSVDVPDGYYAIESTGKNDLAFYRVSHSDRYGISVSLVVGGHADRYVRRNAVAGILDRIAVDLTGSAKRYADELGRCYRCNRHLTDEVSRAAGIGPDCAKREGR